MWALAGVALCLFSCLLLLPFEVLLYQLVLLELLLLLLLREVREHPRQVQVRHVRRSSDTGSRPAARRLALAAFEVVAEIVYFFEDLVVVGEALLLHEVVRALALIHQRHHAGNRRAREWDDVLGAILGTLELLTVVNHGFDRVDLVRRHRLHI